MNSRPVAVLMAGALPVMLGLVAAPQLPVALMPVVESPALSVEVSYPGVGPEKIEEIITRPLEESISTVGGAAEIFSTSEEGKSKINIEFERGADLNRRSLVLRDRIDPVVAGFPSDVQPPVILRYDPSRRPVMIVTLESEKYDLAALREFADREAKKALESVPGVGEVAVAGGREREIIVACNKTALEARGLSLEEVLAAVARQNVDRYAGKLPEAGGHTRLYTRGAFHELEDIRRVPLKAREDRVVRLGQVATVRHAFRDVDSASRLDGQERVSLYVYRAGRASLPELATEARRRLAALEKPDRSFAVRYDSAESIVSAFTYMVFALAFSCTLAAVYLLAVFQFSARDTLAVLVLLPAAGSITAFALFLSGMQFDLLTVSGMILGAGPALLFAVRTIERGPSAIRHYIVVPLLVAAAFVPVFFAGPEVRSVYGGIALALLCEILAALLLVSFVLPVLRDFLPAIRLTLPRLLMLVGDRLRLGLDGLLNLSDRAAGTAARARLLQLSGAILLLVLAMLAVRSMPFEYINIFDARTVTGNLELPSGTSFGVTNALSKTIEARLQKVDGVAEITSRIEADKSTLRLKLDRDIDGDFLDRLKTAAGKTDPGFLYFSNEAGGGGLEEIRVEVLGDELDELVRITRELAGRAEKIDGVHDVVLRYKSPRPELRLVVDPVRAERGGVTVARIGQNLRIAIQGGIATRFTEPAREVDVRIRFDDRWRRELERLREYGIKRPNGRFVPLFTMVRPGQGSVPPKIYRKNKKRTLSFSLKARGVSVDSLLARLDLTGSVGLPEGYRVEYGEAVYRHRAERRRLYLILGLGCLLVFMVLAGLLESLSLPGRLLLAVPLPAALCLLVLYVLGLALSVPALIGLFLMAAVVVFQSLRYRAAGAADKRMEEVSFARLALLLGVFYLPLCLIPAQGGEVLRALSLAMIVGPVSAAVLTPALYRLSSFARSG